MKGGITLSKNVNKAKINVEFNEATTRENLVSGESINTLFGKIKKFLSDLHDSAFTGNADTAKKLATPRTINHTTFDGSANIITAPFFDYLSPQNYSNYNFTMVHDENGYTYTAKALSRDIILSQYIHCRGGEKFRITYDISTSVMGSSSKEGTDSTYLGTAIGVYGRSSSIGDAYYTTRVTASADAEWTTVDSVVTVPSKLHNGSKCSYFYFFLQTEGWKNFSGTLKIRNLTITDISALNYADNVYSSKSHTHSNATTSAAGLMSAADKKKLDELSGGGSGGSSSSTRKSIVIDIDNTTTIDIPFTINDTKNLVVYLNGILLVPSIHYTATTSQITLTGYTAMSGDIVTFVGNENVSTSIDILATEVGIQDTANNFPDANSVENALMQLANNAKELTNANKTNVKLNTDNAMKAKLIAQSNTDYAIKQVRNIIIIPKSQADNLPQGEPGDICIVYNDE